MIFADKLSRHPADALLAITPTRRWTLGDFLQARNSLGPRLKGLNIALRLSDPGVGIEALVATDGYARSVTFIPSTLPVHFVPELLSRAQCDILISDQKGGLDNLSCAVPVFSRLSSVPHESEALTTAVLPCDTLWYLATSGTTGTPKLVAHTLTSLSRTVRGDQSEKTDTRWGLFYDYTRFAGLQVVLQALISGATLIAPALDASLTDKLAMLARQGCTHLSATPTMWRTIVMNPGAKDLPLRQITLGGEIADDRILNTLQTIYPTARVTHIYASTEAGVGFSVKDGRGGFPASYLVEPPAGLALRIIDSRLHIKNNAIIPAYVGTNDRFGNEDGWIDTGDNVDQRQDRVYFLGRASGMINVGGDKVYPEEIEQLLLSHPLIKAVRVYGQSSSIMGKLVAADIVMEHSVVDPKAVRIEIKKYLREKCAAYKIPAIINFVSAVDQTPTGKLLRGMPT